MAAETLSMQATCQAVASKLGVSWHTVRQWTQAARREGCLGFFASELGPQRRK
ncbi:hypothetical protein GC425_01825 [Corynebacterium sp. zg254]|uniref:Helix-turn-helix domain-containing protein n=1 Tax=Corynebacterium zhongnanshanii TaxID=2768834 RepID=A0ABQ6VH91_9CORY|nr:helix-turn-helix domain-containing protein [Corynebacterium zhongnanshanii]KAB3523655.1 hypothetical protein F8377_03800 [Corynebacterium zhongnanshanii]MCR5913608.1 hypothetical protein [Corynebacterium sp. zg254]